MKSIRRQVGQILNYTITDEGYKKAFDTLNKEGRITKKHLIEIIVLLLEREDARDKKE